MSVVNNIITYVKTIWQYRSVQYPNRYSETYDASNYRTDTEQPGSVMQQGTPFSPGNMNHIEDGIEDCANAHNAHIQAENPHGITAAMIGLGNVPNAAADEQTIEFTTQDDVDFQSGDTLSVIVGKIKKALSLKAEAKKASVTVAATAWAGSGPWTATVNCSAATASNTLVVGIGGNLSTDAYYEIANSCILCTAQGSGTITLTAYAAKPENAITVNVMGVNV